MRRYLKPGSKKKLEHCGPAGKVIFRTRAAAEQAIPVVRQQRTKRRPAADVEAMECRAYRCPWANHYHLSSRGGP